MKKQKKILCSQCGAENCSLEEGRYQFSFPSPEEMEKLFKAMSDATLIRSDASGASWPKILFYIRSLQAQNKALEEWTLYFANAAIDGAKSILSHVRYEGHSTMNAEANLEELKQQKKDAMSLFSPISL